MSSDMKYNIIVITEHDDNRSVSL